MEAFETIDVGKANFFALMFFVVALGNLVAYAIAGWLANLIAQVGTLPSALVSSLLTLAPLASMSWRFTAPKSSKTPSAKT